MMLPGVSHTRFLGQAVLVLGFLSFGFAFAASPGTSETLRLTLTDAVSIALKRNSLYQQSLARRDETDALGRQAWSSVLPQASARLSYLYKRDNSNNPFALFGGEPYNFYQFGLEASQPLLKSGFLAGLEAARAQAQAGELDAEISRRDLVGKVIRSFHRAFLAQKELETLKALDQAQEQLFKQARRKARVGSVQKLDADLIESQLALLKPQVLEAQNLFLDEVSAFARTLGVRAEAGVPLVLELDAKTTLPDIQKQLVAAKARAVQGLRGERERLSVVQAQALKEIELSDDLPQVSLVGTWGRNAFVRSDLLNEYATAWTAGIQLSIPLFSGLSSVYERRAADARIRQAELSRQNVLDEQAHLQRSSERTLESLPERLSATERAWSAAQNAYRQAQRQFQLGTTTVFQLTDVQRTYLEARRNRDQLIQASVDALVSWYLASGWDPSELLVR